jgi:hypothetical protein
MPGPVSFPEGGWMSVMSICSEKLGAGAAERGTKSAGVSITRCRSRLDTVDQDDRVRMSSVVAGVSGLPEPSCFRVGHGGAEVS